MLRLVIWWIFFGIMTCQMEFVAICTATNNKAKRNDELYKRIRDLWIDNHFVPIVGYDDRIEDLDEIKIALQFIMAFVCCILVWPFDRIMMYIHWREAVRQAETELRERS